MPSYLPDSKYPCPPELPAASSRRVSPKPRTNPDPALTDQRSQSATKGNLT